MSSTTAIDSLLASRPEFTDEQIHALLAEAGAHRRQRTKEAGDELSARSRHNELPRLAPGNLEKSYMHNDGALMKVDAARFGSKQQQEGSAGIRKVEDPVVAKQLIKESADVILTFSQQKQATAGGDWYNLPRTHLTSELKRDIQLLKMRGVLDPHRHYKKDNGKLKIPEFSQIGTVTEGVAEFFSGRIENRRRKRTFAEEVLAAEEQNGRFRRKYAETQARKASGKKAHYKALMAQRKKGVKKGG